MWKIWNTYFPSAKHSSLTVEPFATGTISGNWTSIFGSYSPITPGEWKAALNQAHWQPMRVPECQHIVYLFSTFTCNAATVQMLLKNCLLKGFSSMRDFTILPLSTFCRSSHSTWESGYNQPPPPPPILCSWHYPDAPSAGESSFRFLSRLPKTMRKLKSTM